jgi:hypothetical protein
MKGVKGMFGKTGKKLVFGVGLGALATGVIAHVAPQWAGHPITKVGETVLSYSIGGVESAIGTAIQSVAMPSMTRGSRSLDNIQTESL